jgi:hypothetical protein
MINDATTIMLIMTAALLDRLSNLGLIWLIDQRFSFSRLQCKAVMRKSKVTVALDYQWKVVLFFVGS